MQTPFSEASLFLHDYKKYIATPKVDNYLSPVSYLSRLHLCSHDEGGLLATLTFLYT